MVHRVFCGRQNTKNFVFRSQNPVLNKDKAMKESCILQKTKSNFFVTDILEQNGVPECCEWTTV